MTGKIKLFLAAVIMAAGIAQAENIALIYNGATIADEVVVSASTNFWQQNGFSVAITNGGSVDVQYTSRTTNMQLGQQAVSSITIDGGALTFNGPNSLLIGNGSGGSGTIDLRAGSFDSTPGATLFIGRDQADGVVIIRGGAVTMGKKPTFDAIASGRPAGNGSIDFSDKLDGETSDGTLTISGADESYYEELYSAGDLTFNGANAFVFTDVFNVSGETISVDFSVEVPVAVISATTTNGPAPLEVVFDGSSSTGPTNIASYSWDFGDGNVGDGAIVTNTYAAGNFTAELTIVDENGASDTVAVDVLAYNTITADVTATPTEGEGPLEVVFDASGSTSSGTIGSYAWDFGDGNTDAGAMVTNTYMTSGVYTSVVVVADSNGLSDTNSVVINVIPERYVEFTTQTAGTTAADAFPETFVPVSTNDLADSSQASFLSLVDNTGDLSEVTNINNGVAGTSANDGNQVLLEAEDSFSITFDTTVNTLGYDITGINTYAGWNPLSGGRANQGYDVTVTFMDDSTLLLSSGTYEPNDTPNSWTAVYMTGLNGGVIASGVKQITFSNFDEYNEGISGNDVIAYREFDVLGTPTGAGEIGTVAYEILPDGEGLVLSWQGVLGVSYGVEATKDLVNTPWTSIATGLNGSGDLISVTNALTVEQRFYRAYIED